MLSFKYEGTADSFNIELFLLQYADIIRKEAVNDIKESMELGLDEAHVAEFEVEGQYIDYTLPKDQWKYFLEESKDNLISNEEYEVLIVADDLIKNL